MLCYNTHIVRVFIAVRQLAMQCRNDTAIRYNGVQVTCKPRDVVYVKKLHCVTSRSSFVKVRTSMYMSRM